MALAGNPQPVYPPLARRRGLEGRVVLRVAVAADGAVQEVTVLRGSGHAMLDEAAREAVSRWRFRPATTGAGPVSAAVEIPVSFRLH